MSLFHAHLPRHLLIATCHMRSHQLLNPPALYFSASAAAVAVAEAAACTAAINASLLLLIAPSTFVSVCLYSGASGAKLCRRPACRWNVLRASVLAS